MPAALRYREEGDSHPEVWRSAPWGDRPFSLRCFSFLLSQTFSPFPQLRAKRQNDLAFYTNVFSLFQAAAVSGEGYSFYQV